MYIDPIVEEVRAIRQAYAAEFDFDPHAMCEDLRRRDKESRGKTVTRPPQPYVDLRKPKVAK